MSRLTKHILIKLAMAAGFLLVYRAAQATDVAYSGTFVGTEGLATKTGQTASATYTRDMNTTGDRVSFQITYSSYTGTLASKTFTDGSASSGTITVSSNPAGGLSSQSVTVNGINVPFNYDTTYASMTATNICSSMTATTSLNAIVHCQAIGAIVFSTSTAVGTAVNYTLTTSSPTALVPSGATLLGGTNAAYTINTPTITIASNGFTTGMQVLYSGTPAISGLTTGTTYYASMISPNATTGLASTFKLASSLANAQAGTGIVLASSRTNTTADTYTLAPLPFTNTSGGGFQLQWSDDNSNWTNISTGNYGVAIASVTFAAAGATTLYDLGPVQHRYLRASETPPTTGAVTYTCTDNERYSFKH